MKRKTSIRCIVAAVWGIAVMAGCATPGYQVQRQPTLNTEGIRSLTVMRFTVVNNSSLDSYAARQLTRESERRIKATKRFTMIDRRKVEQAERQFGRAEDVVDALFTGQVISVIEKYGQEQRTRTNADGVESSYTLYQREITLSFSYSLTRTRGGEKIGPISKTNLKGADSNEEISKLKTNEVLVREIIQSSLVNLGRDVAPYTVTLNLEKLTSKDRAVQQRIKDVDELVKSGDYRGALGKYLAIYHDNGIIAAAINAARINEGLGNLEEAVVFMQKVATDNKEDESVQTELVRLRGEMESLGLTGEQESVARRNKVIALMVETLPPRMPSEPKVAVINCSQAERDLADTVINGIIQGLQTQKINVVDRSNLSLLDIERRYQISGSVSDDEMISIGQEAGINTIILVSVIDSDGKKRLSVKMLDVGQKRSVYESLQTDEMNL